MEMALRWYGIWHEYVGVDMKRNSTPHFWRSFLKICLEHCDCLTSFGEFPMNQLTQNICPNFSPLITKGCDETFWIHVRFPDIFLG